MNKATILLLLLIVNNAFPQTIKSLDNRSAKLPPQFTVTSQGIKWVQPGLKEPVFVSWERINLDALAKEEPKIEEARQKAILTQKDISISTPPPRNYYKEFLAIPINVSFKEKWELATASKSNHRIVVEGYDESTGYYSTASSASSSYNSSTQYINTSRPSLNTTMEGLFLKMSDDTNIDGHRFINDLRQTGEVYENVKVAFSNLQAAYPHDIEVTRTIAALDRLMYEKTTSVDAMRQMKKFVEYAKNKKITH